MWEKIIQVGGGVDISLYTVSVIMIIDTDLRKLQQRQGRQSLAEIHRTVFFRHMFLCGTRPVSGKNVQTRHSKIVYRCSIVSNKLRKIPTIIVIILCTRTRHQY